MKNLSANILIFLANIMMLPCSMGAAEILVGKNLTGHAQALVLGELAQRLNKILTFSEVLSAVQTAESLLALKRLSQAGPSYFGRNEYEIESLEDALDIIWESWSLKEQNEVALEFEILKNLIIKENKLVPQFPQPCTFALSPNPPQIPSQRGEKLSLKLLSQLTKSGWAHDASWARYLAYWDFVDVKHMKKRGMKADLVLVDFFTLKTYRIEILEYFPFKNWQSDGTALEEKIIKMMKKYVPYCIQWELIINQEEER